MPLGIGLLSGGAAAGIATAAGATASWVSFAFSVGFLVSTMAYSALTAESSKSRAQSYAKDFKYPTNHQGLPVPVIYGTQTVAGFIGTDSNFKATKNETGGGGGGSGIGGSSAGSVYYTYAVRFQYILCMGIVDVIRDIQISKKSVFKLDQGVAKPDAIPYTDGLPTTLTTRFGSLDFFWGVDVQSVCNYIIDHVDTSTPLFNNVCYMATSGDKRWKLGTSPNLQPITVTLSRYPKTPIADCNEAINSWSANPAGVILDILTNPFYGLRLPYSYLNLGSFAKAAAIFKAEELGISFTMERAQAANSYIEDIKAWTNSYLYIDQNGLITIKVMREDSLEQSTAANVIEITDEHIIPGTLNVQVGSWLDTISVLKAEYVDGQNDMVTKQIILEDLSRSNAASHVKQETINLSGIDSPEAATAQANRIFALRSTPIAKASVEINRRSVRPWIGMRVYLKPSSWSSNDWFIGYIVEVTEKEAASNTVQITIVEDVIGSMTQVTFGKPDATVADDAILLYPFDRARCFTLPSGLNNSYTIEPRILAIAGQSPNDAVDGYRVWARDTGSTDDYRYMMTRTSIVPAGDLRTALSASSSAVDALQEIYVCLDGYNDEFVVSVTSTDWQANRCLMLVGNELISVLSVEAHTYDGQSNASDTIFDSAGLAGCTNLYKITGLRRGVLGSTQAAHLAGDDVYFIRCANMDVLSDYGVNPEISYGGSYDILLQPLFLTDDVDVNDITAYTLVIPTV